MISLKYFKEYKNILENTITNKAFRSRLLFEAIKEESFSDDILAILSRLDDNISSNELDTIFEEIRNKTDDYYKLSINSNILIDKINNGLRSLAYFYFLECMNEYSILSDNIIEQIKIKYPNDYLEIISKIDKVYLSCDTKKQIASSDCDLIVKEDLLEKYIILKQWQDKQHYYFENGYGKYLEEIQYQYCNNRNLNSFDLEQFTLRKRLFDELSNLKILDIDLCSILTELYIKKYVIKYIGGKMYGLSVLNSKGIKIPYSVVVPVGVEITESDLELVDKKYMYFSVRSSADTEDGEENSFAGMFDSYLNVSRNEIFENINKVKSSVNNVRLKKYIQANNLQKPNMAVVIQSFREPEYAGVWIGNSDDSGVLEWVYGNGEKLVSGSSTPHTEVWNDGSCVNSLELNNQAIGSKMLEYQQKVGSNADFEWMILDNEVVMLQFRPVTKKVIIDEDYSKNYSNGYYGIPASVGYAKGKARYLESPEEEIISDKILLAKMTDPDWLVHLINSKGAITAYGGFLCHSAIVCRELGIPCITGVGEETLKELIKDEFKYIEMNGSNGNIKIVDE